VIAISFIWAHVGGLQNPLFLVAFALPVVGAIFLSRWQPYLMAALSALMVTLVACSEAPELRWYAPWLGAAGRWLDALFGGEGGASLPFAAFSAPSQYYVVLLEVFAIMVFACAVAAEYLAKRRAARSCGRRSWNSCRCRRCCWTPARTRSSARAGPR
jgi:hypothetical protein